MGDIGPSDSEEFKIALATQGKRKQQGVGLDKQSINNALKTLASIWNHTTSLGLYTGENPVTNIERYKLPRTLDKDYLDANQVDVLPGAAQKYGEVKFVRFSACRCGNIPSCDRGMARSFYNLDDAAVRSFPENV